MKTESLKRLSILGLSSEQMTVVLDVFAVELAPMERTRDLAAQRQQRYIERNSNVRITSPAQRQDNVIYEPSRVIDTTLPSLLNQVKKEESKEELSHSLSKPLPKNSRAHGTNPRALGTNPREIAKDPQGFADFWEIYPRRAEGSGRPAAVKAYGAQLRRGISFGTIMDGTRRYRAHCDATGKTGTQFVFKARTWLNDSGWNETYETARTNHKPNTIAGGFDLIDRAIEERFGSGKNDIEHVPGLLKIAS